MPGNARGTAAGGTVAALFAPGGAKPERVGDRMRAALSMQFLTYAARCVVAEVAHHDGKGGARVSHESIGAVLGMSRQTVAGHLAAARRAGAVTWEAGKHANLYTIAYGMAALAAQGVGKPDTLKAAQGVGKPDTFKVSANPDSDNQGVGICLPRCRDLPAKVSAKPDTNLRTVEPDSLGAPRRAGAPSESASASTRARAGGEAAGGVKLCATDGCGQRAARVVNGVWLCRRCAQA